MANLIAQASTVSNTGATLATFGANFNKHVQSQADNGREFVLSITAAGGTLTDAKLKACLDYLTTSHGSAGTGDSAGTIAAVNTTDDTPFNPAADTVVHVRFQTTDSFTVTGVNAAATDTVVAVLASFRPAL